MIKIKAACPTCGDVDLVKDEIKLWVDVASDDKSFYIFTCPNCGLDVFKPTNKRVIEALISVEVQTMRLASPHWPQQSPPPHPAHTPKAAPKLAPDDEIDIHILLNGDDAEWLAKLMPTTNPEDTP